MHIVSRSNGREECGVKDVVRFSYVTLSRFSGFPRQLQPVLFVMRGSMIWSTWEKRWRSALAACERLGGSEGELTIGLPAQEHEVIAVEEELQIRLPSSFRQVLTQFSAEVNFRWFLPQIKLPEPLREIFSGECYWSLPRLAEIEAGRKEWVKACFPDPDDEYERVWHNKLAFAEVSNGDMLALDLSLAEAPVVYLSHDGGEGHGYRLGADFADYINRSTLLGCPGAEDWQMLPFLASPIALLDPYGSNAELWRGIFGLSLDE